MTHAGAGRRRNGAWAVAAAMLFIATLAVPSSRTSHAEAAAQTAQDCQLRRADGNRALSFPLQGQPSTGVLNPVVLFVDFPDLPGGDKPTQAMAGNLFDFTEEYVAQVSQGRATVEVRPHLRWLRASRPRNNYMLGLRSAPISRDAFVDEVKRLAPAWLDVNSFDVLWIITPDSDRYRTSISTTRFAPGQEPDTVVTLTVQSDAVMMHEALHGYGLPDLYEDDTTLGFGENQLNFAGPFDPMSWWDSRPELMAWQRWLLGWIDDHQVACVTAFPSFTTLEPLGSASQGTKAAVVHIDKHRVLVVENRQLAGYDNKPELLPTPGLLVYLIDARVASGQGPLRVQGTSTGTYPDASVLLQAGESVAAGGYVVEAVNGPNDLQALIMELCGGKTPTINMLTNGGDGTGTAGDDVIVGTGGADTIDAKEGDDTICAGGGNDIIAAGSGNDTVFGNRGDDEISGNEGRDVLEGGQGNDTITGDAGNDTISGGVDDDRLFGGQGHDTMLGGPGQDSLHGNRGNDTLDGGEGHDRIFGYQGDDTITGGDGHDRLHGNFGDDIIAGDHGNDRLWGYADDDVLSGGNGRDIIVGNFGDDTLTGGGGNDTLYGSDGVDTLEGDAGSDALHGNAGNDQLNGNDGDDMLDGGINFDRCIGSNGIDTASRCEEVGSVP